ncbi:monocarboxylate transporter 9-like [Palaemon carinicauda]|uniref:monocarboxylate transporter 9-like n=1 Tax=Palaemon carinicauda TaxID=392227 RepID=UPI0035B5A3DE
MLSPLVGVCSSIIFLNFLVDLNTSSTVIVWIFNFQNFIFNMVGFMAGSLIEVFGTRRVTVFGAFLASLSMIISAFATSAEFLFFSFSIIGGLGSGTLVCISLLVVPSYFDEKRGRANSIVMAGFCIGQMICPILSQYLVDTYGFRIGAFIAGTILLNCCASSSLFHPVEWHSMKKRTEEGLNEHSTNRSNKKSNERDCNGEEAMLDTSYRQCELQTQMRGEERTYCHNNKNASFVPVRTFTKVVNRTVENMKIMKTPQALIIAVSNTIYFNAYANFLLLVPFAMQHAGHSLESSAWCIAVAGICNLITRIAMNSLADYSWFKVTCAYKIGLALVGICNFAFPVINHIHWLMVIMGLWGCGIGATVGVYTSIMIEILGPEKMPACFGVTSLCIGIGYITVAPIMGYVRDLSSSYLISMWVSSGFVTVSFILWLMMPCASEYEKRKEGRVL